MWAKRSPLLQTLTALASKKVTFKCTFVEQKAFDGIKQIVACNKVLIHLDFNKRLDIHTDASDLNIRAVIIHNEKPIFFYSHKLTGPKMRYTVTEKELLSIVKTLKEFCTILLVQQLSIYTYHENITCKKFNNYRVLWWRLLLEEYGPDIKYITG